jgi:hypothetical protein
MQQKAALGTAERGARQRTALGIARGL